MKVLKQGRKQKGWTTKATCTGNGNGKGGCGAKLLVEEPDLFQTTRCARDEVDYFVTFRCPNCGVLTDIDNYPKRAADLPQDPTKVSHARDARD